MSVCVLIDRLLLLIVWVLLDLVFMMESDLLWMVMFFSVIFLGGSFVKVLLVVIVVS